MLDHLIFNKLKWFSIADNSNAVNANGKSYYACPEKITLIGGKPFKATTSYIVEDLEVNCVAVGKDHYYVTGPIPWTNEPGKGTLQYFDGIIDVPKTSCKNPIWGGRKPLLARLSAVFRKAVVAC